MAAATVIATPFKLLKQLLFNPVAAGPLLYVLTRGPEGVRESLLRGIRVDAVASLLNTSSANVISNAITILKWTLTLGVLSRLNSFLNKLALNQWSLKPQGEPFDWQSGKEIVCITGGSSGFGALMVKRFLEKTNVKIVVIDIQDLPKHLQALPNVHFYKCDLTQPEKVKEAAEAIKAEIGNPSVLINNAGIAKPVLIIDATPEWTEKIFRVNIISHWQTVAAFLPEMLNMKKGHIVTIASMASFVTAANIADYSATKAGLVSFHEGLNQELKHRYANGRCIKTTIVHPNFAETPMVTQGMQMTGAGQDMAHQLLPPALIANTVVRQVLRGTSAQIVIPREQIRIASIRAWPMWLQELLRDVTRKFTAPQTTSP